jgi:hypothetical protein
MAGMESKSDTVGGERVHREVGDSVKGVQDCRIIAWLMRELPLDRQGVLVGGKACHSPAHTGSPFVVSQISSLTSMPCYWTRTREYQHAIRIMEWSEH